MRSELLPRVAITDDRRHAMYRLLAQHYGGVSASQFKADLDRKNWAVLLFNEDQLVGFSTLLFRNIRLGGEWSSVVFSGDTVTDPRAWRSTVLPRAWIDAVTHLHDVGGRGRLWWLLITSGFRTYRFLPVFWREFYPRHDRPTPPHIATLMGTLGRHLFGHGYDAGRGIVRLEHPQTLRPHLYGIPASRRKDPHVAFFATRNPGHHAGDELVCLTELAPANLTRAGRRMVESPAPRALPLPTGAS